MPMNPDELEGLGSVVPDSGVTPEEIEGMEAQQVTGPQETSFQAGQAAMIEGLAVDQQALSIGEMQIDGRAHSQNAAQKLYDRLIGESEAYLQQRLVEAQGAEAMRMAIESNTNERQTYTEARTSPVATEQAVIRAIDKTEDEKRRDELIAQLAMRADVAKMREAQGVGESIVDFAGYLLPFGEAIDIHDVKDEIANDPTLSTSLSTVSVPAMVMSFQSLPSDRKLAVWPALRDAVIRATGTNFVGLVETDGNLTKAAGILLDFLRFEGDENLKSARDLDVAFGVADTLPVGGAVKLAKTFKVGAERTKHINDLVKIMSNTETRRSNSVRINMQADNIEQAVEINIRSMVDEQVARTHGLDVQAARDNALMDAATPFEPEKTPGLSVELASSLQDFMNRAQGFTRRMTTESEMMTIGALNKTERARAIEGFKDRMRGVASDYQQEGINMSDVEILGSDSRGFNFRYTLADNTVKVPLRVTLKDGTKTTVTTRHAPRTYEGRMSWKVNESNGKYMATAEFVASRGGVSGGKSPNAWSVKTGENGDFGQVVNEAIVLEDIAIASQQRIANLFVEANEGIKGIANRKQRRLLEEIEIQGDEYINPQSHERGKVFMPDELSEMGLTNPKAQEAYYKRRVVADQMHALQNFQTRRELELGGFGVTRVMGHNILAKMFDNPNAAMNSIRSRRLTNLKVFDQATQKMVDATPEMMEEAYASGKRLVRSREPFNTTGAGDMAKGLRADYILINDAKRMQPLPSQVLHYHKGYVPKISEGVEFVVKRKIPVERSGFGNYSASKPLRAFGSRKQVDEFITQQATSRVLKQGVKETDEGFSRLVEAEKAFYEVADGSVMSQIERMENALSSSKGLFVGTRAQDDLLMGLSGQALDRMNPTEAMERYFSHLGRSFAKNEWRVGIEQKWLNTVRAAADKLGMDARDIRGFRDTNVPVDSALGRSLELMKDRIIHWNGIQTREESFWQQTVQRFNDGLLTGLQKFGYSKEFVPSVVNVKNRSVISLIKAVNMHTFLGVWNPAQLYVQGSAAVVALSTLNNLSDIPRVLRRQENWRQLDNIINAKGVVNEDEIYKVYMQKGLVDADDVAAHQLWRRTGLKDSVRSNADLDTMKASGNMSANMFRRAVNSDLFFYQAGELFNRRVSFQSALANWQDANKGRRLDSITDDELIDITSDAQSKMLKLNAANRAWWQGGRGTSATREVLGMTTQFLQVISKTAEAFLKPASRGGFTLTQKGKIAGGQAVAFGATGVPILNYAVPALSEYFDGDVPDSAALVFNQGAAGVLAHVLAGAGFEEKFEVGSRASLLTGMTSLVKDILTDETPIPMMMLGVGAHSGSRFLEAMASLSPVMLSDRSGQAEWTGPDFKKAAVSVLSIPTSGRNLFKAYMMANHHKVLDRQGRSVLDEEFGVSELLGQAAGFRLTEEVMARMVQMSNRDFEQLVDETAQTIIDMHHDWVYLHNRDAEHGELLKRKMQYIYESIDNPALLRDVKRAVENRIFRQTQSLKEREMKKFWERTAPEELTNGLTIDMGVGAIAEEKAVVRPLSSIPEEDE